MARAELRDELIALLRPAARRAVPQRRSWPRSADVPAFRPLSFLSTIADKVGDLAGGRRGPRRPRTRRPRRRCRRRRRHPDQRRHPGRAVGDVARRGLGTRPAGPLAAPPADARVRGRDDRRVRRAARRSTVRGRRGDRRRPGPPRRPPGRRHRPAEGRRHRREHPAQLRDAASGGLPQGDAGDGARRALRPAGRHVRRRPRRPSRARSRRSAASPRPSPGPSGS